MVLLKFTVFVVGSWFIRLTNGLVIFGSFSYLINSIGILSQVILTFPLIVVEQNTQYRTC